MFLHLFVKVTEMHSACMNLLKLSSWKHHIIFNITTTIVKGTWVWLNELQGFQNHKLYDNDNFILD